MLCSSGFSRLSYGSPYWMPTARSAAAPARIAASAVAAPPQRASAQRPTGVLDLRRRVGDPEDRELRRLANSTERAPDDDPLCSLRLRRACTVGVGDVDDHRDPIPFGDGLAEATRAPLCHGRIVTTTSEAARRPID